MAQTTVTDPAEDAILRDMEREIEAAVATATEKARHRLRALDERRASRPALPDVQAEPLAH